MKKERLDVLLTERGLVETRSLAQRLVMAGQVRVDGQVISKPSTKILHSARIDIEHGPRFVSRGGEKLEGALQAFGLTKLDGRVCADVGSSTGGFTDALLQHGAEKVYAIDVGYGILHWKLRSDPRVISMERTNARYIANLPEPVHLVTVDASFISLKILLPVISGWFPHGGGELIALIKPQFEAGRQDAAKGEGVIRDPEVHRQVLLDVLRFSQGIRYSVRGLVRSTLVGPKGNAEFLTWLTYPGQGEIELVDLVREVVEEQGDSPAIQKDTS
jgi:23S rRNA (cytidine1920-2'-O)/16S rRNA (cytidine1409-2'-O)-methyltransferase